MGQRPGDVRSEKAEPSGQSDEVPGLGSRPDRDRDEMQVVPLGASGASLDEVRGDRYCGSPELRLQSEALSRREPRGCAIQIDHERIGELERF